MSLIQIFILSILVESIWETLKMLWDKGKFNNERLGVLILSIFIAFLVQADMIQILGFDQTLPYVGLVLTAILLSRGSNFIHDIVKKMMEVMLKTP